MNAVVPARPLLPSLASFEQPKSPVIVAPVASDWTRRICWLTLAILHLTACAFFSLFAVVYTQLSDTAFGSNTFLYDLILPLRYLPVVGFVSGAIGGLHLTLAVRMIYASIKYRRLMFKLRSRSLNSRTFSTLRLAVAAVTARPLVARARSVLRKLQKFALLPLDTIIGRHGWIGVDGPYFDHFFVLRELVQVALQVVQLHKMSRLLSATWMVHVYVAIACANCWSSQVVHVLSVRARRPSESESHQKRRRLYMLLLDAFLDNVATFFMPLVIVLPYVAQYDRSLRSFPLAVWGDDLWVMRVVADIQLLFVVSWGDFVMKLVFSLLVLVSTYAIHDLCHEQFDAAPTMTVNPNSSKPKTATHAASVRLVRIRAVAHAVLAIGGLALLVIHGYASLQPPVDGCLRSVRPWFYGHASCAVFYYDCHVRGSSGAYEDTHTALARLSPGPAVYLIFRHCPVLEMPSNIQAFQNLIGIKVYNATITEWSAKAAVHSDFHRFLRQIAIVRVAFPNDGDGLPEGLVNPKFPRTVADVNVCVSNLKRLPADLDTKWPRGLSLLLEFSRFDAFPEVITRMDVTTVSLNGNHLTSVPVDKLLLPDRRLRILSVGGNPLVDVGHHLTKVVLPPAFYWIIIDMNRQLTALPPWLANDPAIITRLWLIAGGTPVCDEVLRFRTSPAPPPEGFYWQQFVDCTPYPPPMRSLFRLFTEDARSSLARDKIGDPQLA